MPFIGNYSHGTSIINFGQEGTFSGNITAGGNSDSNGIGNSQYCPRRAVSGRSRSRGCSRFCRSARARQCRR